MAINKRAPLTGLDTEIPPDISLVRIYFEANGSTIENSEKFYRYYQKLI